MIPWLDPFNFLRNTLVIVMIITRRTSVASAAPCTYFFESSLVWESPKIAMFSIKKTTFWNPLRDTKVIREMQHYKDPAEFFKVPHRLFLCSWNLSLFFSSTFKHISQTISVNIVIVILKLIKQPSLGLIIILKSYTELEWCWSYSLQVIGEMILLEYRKHVEQGLQSVLVIRMFC